MFSTPTKIIEFDDEQEKLLKDNLEKNVISLATEHPDTTFIYYISPYNVAWWGGTIQDGYFEYYLDAIQYAMEMLCKCDNIRLYCYANRTDLTTDLSMYSDEYHYINSVSSDILKWIAADENLVTEDNYMEYVEKMREFYGGYKYKERFVN